MRGEVAVLNSYELVAAITALAVSIAQDYPDNTELDVLGSIFVQLGETLETIALQRELEENRRIPSAQGGRHAGQEAQSSL